MTARAGFEVQGHRGARGLRPENALSGFELALDLGVSSIETDVHLTRDGVPVLSHDPWLFGAVCSQWPSPQQVSGVTLARLRLYPPDDRDHGFPEQKTDIGPLAQRFADATKIDPRAMPTLRDLLVFAADYSTEGGRLAGKTPAQQQRAQRVVLDFELKRVPFWPAFIGDLFDGSAASTLERRVVEEVQRAGMLDRVRIRSFDHRSVRAIRALEPQLRTAVLVHHTAPVRPVDLLAAAGAEMYCPDYAFVDAATVQEIHAAGKTIMPWTVNEPAEWERLIAWNVDGITTDYPDRLLAWLRKRGIAVAGDESRPIEGNPP